mmetsp:Transcript_18191/g.54664  ORF Transcript_18191/g.54664 Transcript_18191/m.54664 type:complete len:310 (+) Transcript_18191:390-1319(+)
MTQPLALDSAPAGQAPGWRRHEDLIDALPYVDAMTPEEKQKVDRLIQEEMKNSTMRPAAYLKDLPPAYQLNFEGHPILKAELARVKAGIPMEPLDDIRYRLEKPSLSKRNDVGAWKKALDNAHSQLGHQHNRVINLELLLKFGPKAWRVQNARLAAANGRLEAEVAEVRAEVEAVNRERKLQQTAAGADLASLQTQWHQLVHKNAEIERACQRLEAEVAAAQAAIGPHQTGGDGAAVAEDGVPAGAPPADTPVADGDTSVADGDTAAEEPQPVAGTSLGDGTSDAAVNGPTEGAAVDGDTDMKDADDAV